MKINSPEWVKHAIFYQIFPDRFARSSRIHHAKGISFKKWGSSPKEQGFQGGDLLGIVDKLDYLQELGITAIYLNPIFASASNHRYHPYDYFQVDPLLGGNDALRELLTETHNRNMRVILDGVFNHASRGFWPFHHILENGPKSPYIDWFHIKGWPLRPYRSSKKYPANYKAWWNIPALPKLNTKNPGVRQYVFDVAKYWIDFGIDGWRLDVPEEIDDDSFWQEFRKVVKSANPDAYLCGEIWGDATQWLQGDQFDGVMNYLFTEAALGFFGATTIRKDYRKSDLKIQQLDAPTFAKKIEKTLNLYDWEINQAQMNLIGSHDMARPLWIMGEDDSALRLCALFQMTMPGAPCIYYGDEIGLSAGDDPYCREAFPWDNQENWNNPLLQFYQRITAMRESHSVLRTGTFQILYAKANVFAFLRKLSENSAIVIFNTDINPVSCKLQIPNSTDETFKQIWPENENQKYFVEDGAIEVEVGGRNALLVTNY